MALYSIESEQCLGMSHHGAVTVNGESAVELSDEEVDILVKLIKEKGTTDVEALDLPIAIWPTTPKRCIGSGKAIIMAITSMILWN